MKTRKKLNLIAQKLLIFYLLLASCCSCSLLQKVDDQDLVREEKVKELLSKGLYELRSGESNSVLLANASFELAQELKPGDARVLDALGCAQFRLGDIDSAAGYFKESIRVEPEFDRAYSHLALVAEFKRDNLAAYELYRIALQKNPLNYRARNNLAVFLSERGIDMSFKESAVKEILRARQAGSKSQRVTARNLAQIMKDL